MPSIAYRLQSSRSRRQSIRIAVRADGEVVVTASRLLPRLLIDTCVRQKSSWIQRTQEKRRISPRRSLQGDRAEFLGLREQAHAFARQRLNAITTRLGVTYAKLTMRNTKTRWGSCSRRGAISIHYKILFLPNELATYLLIHEACHLKEMDHGPGFWDLVSTQCPDYLSRRRALRAWIVTGSSV